MRKTNSLTERAFVPRPSSIPPPLLRLFLPPLVSRRRSLFTLRGACGVGSRLANPHHCPSPYLGTRLTHLSSPL